MMQHNMQSSRFDCRYSDFLFCFFLYRVSSPVSVWKSNVAVSSASRDPLVDGLHLSSHVLQWDSQILLNYICNKVVRPSNASCCVARIFSTSVAPEASSIVTLQKLTSLQIVSLALLATWFVTTLHVIFTLSFGFH